MAFRVSELAGHMPIASLLAGQDASVNQDLENGGRQSAGTPDGVGQFAPAYLGVLTGDQRDEAEPGRVGESLEPVLQVSALVG